MISSILDAASSVSYGLPLLGRRGRFIPQRMLAQLTSGPSWVKGSWSFSNSKWVEVGVLLSGEMRTVIARNSKV
jgi:hypothetical protein